MNTNNSTSTLEKVARRLRSERRKLGSWDEVARHYGLTKALVWRVAKQNYEPRRPEIRRALGLPVHKLAPVCPMCGDIHQLEVCPVGKAVDVVIREGEQPRPVQVKHRKLRKPPTRWIDWPVKALREAIRNRVEV